MQLINVFFQSSPSLKHFFTSIALLGVPLNCDNSIDFLSNYVSTYVTLHFCHFFGMYDMASDSIIIAIGVVQDTIIIAIHWSFHHVVNQLSICARPRAAGVQLINVFIQSSPSPFHVLTSITLSDVP